MYTVQSSPPLAVDARGLVKRYGAQRALDGFDLQVAPGRVCGLLGPNGAGKTTAVRVLATLLRADGGEARVAGFDVARQPHAVRARIGLSGQSPAVDEILSGRQNLVIFGRLTGLDRRTARARAEELLAGFDLGDAAGKPVKQYSGGMRRRIDLAVTLILAPQVLFLDEPTTGLDPRNRNDVWQAIRALVAGGATVLLTTQYLEEADQLADDIVVIDGGRVVGSGSPAELKARVGRDRVEVGVEAADLEKAAAVVGAAVDGEVVVAPERRLLSVAVADRVAGVRAVLGSLEAAGIAVADIAMRQPTLDDVFLALTGRPTADGAADASGSGEGPADEAPDDTSDGAPDDDTSDGAPAAGTGRGEAA